MLFHIEFCSKEASLIFLELEVETLQFELEIEKIIFSYLVLVKNVRKHQI